MSNFKCKHRWKFCWMIEKETSYSCEINDLKYIKNLKLIQQFFYINVCYLIRQRSLLNISVIKRF